jgi:hypothetical protein
LAIGPVDYQKNRREHIGVYGFLSRNPREIASKIASCQEVRTAFRALNRVRSIAINQKRTCVRFAVVRQPPGASFA